MQNIPQNKIRITKDGVTMHINLADFPHGELIGRRKDDNYDIEFYAAAGGVTVPAYDEATNTIVQAPVYSWSIHHGKATEIVELANGSQIYTDHDPRAVYGIPADSTTLQLERFTPTDALARQVMVPVAKAERPGREVKQFAAYYDFETNQVSATKTTNAVALDFEFGQFLGCKVGDGWWDKTDYDNQLSKAFGSKRLYLADKEGENAEFVYKYLCTKVPGVWSMSCKEQHAAADTSRYGDSVKYTYWSKSYGSIVATALTELLGGERDESTSGSANKRLPVWAPAAPAEFIWGLIAGYIATDGTVTVVAPTAKGGRKQLQVSLTSTSIVLLQDVRNLLGLVGVHSNITYSKTTSANNHAWILSLSTPALKQQVHNLDKMCNTRKLQVLQDTPVQQVATAQRNQHIPVPAGIAAIVKHWLVSPKITPEMWEDTSELYADKKALSSFSISIYSGIKAGYLTVNKAHELLEYFQKEVAQRKAAQQVLRIALLPHINSSATKTPYNSDIDSAFRTALDLYLPVRVRTLDKDLDTNIRKLKRLMDKGIKQGSINTSVLTALHDLTNLPLHPGAEGEALIAKWKTIVGGDYNWTMVKDVQYTNIVEDGYDLCVPGYETFLSSDGIVLSNTVNVHVPIFDKTVKETKEKLMPSVSPFSNRESDKLVPLPKQEQILGLYTAATAPSTGQKFTFKSEADAVAAIRRGEVPLSADVEIK